MSKTRTFRPAWTRTLRRIGRLHVVDTLIGILLSASAAAIVAYLFHNSHVLAVVPLLFLGMVTVVALRYGVAAGVIGSLISGFIFAIFLFSPLGSVRVAGEAARANLGWLLLGGTALSVLFAPQQKNRGR
jgi:K+-sensing histidine kinase KdpD